MFPIFFWRDTFINARKVGSLQGRAWPCIVLPEAQPVAVR